MLKTFTCIDDDGNGSLEAYEIRGKLGDNLSEEYYKKLMNDFDQNGDGEVRNWL